MKKEYKKPLVKIHATTLRGYLMEGTEQSTGTGESGGGGHGYDDPAKRGFFDDSWGGVWEDDDY
ncbi:MAG: hypothetical protein IKX24_01845 [Prevotella sp.]|nr:hypothetical protein [Prevotella sp.]